MVARYIESLSPEATESKVDFKLYVLELFYQGGESRKLRLYQKLFLCGECSELNNEKNGKRRAKLTIHNSPLAANHGMEE